MMYQFPFISPLNARTALLFNIPAAVVFVITRYLRYFVLVVVSLYWGYLSLLHFLTYSFLCVQGRDSYLIVIKAANFQLCSTHGAIVQG